MEKMKLNINGYEVEIKAKTKYHERLKKEDTLYFLNQISMWASKAAEYDKYRGRDALAEDAENAGNEIYKFLEENGFYE